MTPHNNIQQRGFDRFFTQTYGIIGFLIFRKQNKATKHKPYESYVIIVGSYRININGLHHSHIGWFLHYAPES